LNKPAYRNSAISRLCGKLIEGVGSDNFLSSLEASVAFAQMEKDKDGNPIHSRKEIIKYHNYPRNALKHLNVDGRDDVNFDLKEKAHDIVERAVFNIARYWGWHEIPEYRDFKK
jgi:hypothetical protein